MNSFVQDVTLENAQQVIIEGSAKQLVLVQFWSERSEACNSLMSVLEGLVQQHAGQFVLAKVNCDQQPDLAAHFGVRSLPTVALFKAGQPVDGFSGPQPEAVIRDFLAKHLPNEQDNLLLQAQQLLAKEDALSAYPLLTQAFAGDNTRTDIKFALISCCLSVGKAEQAKQLLDAIPLQDQNSEFQGLLAQYELAIQASESPEIKALEARLAAQPDDKAIAMQLAVQYSQADRKEQALTLLFEAILLKEINYADGEAKRAFLSIIATLPDGDPIASQFRRKLYTVLY